MLLGTKLAQETLHIGVRGHISLFDNFSMELASISTPLIPTSQEILLVGHNLFWTSFPVQKERSLGRLLHFQVVIDRPTCYSNLPGNVSDIGLLLTKVMNAMIQFDALLMELHTLFFLLLGFARMGGAHRTFLLWRRSLGWINDRLLESR